MLLFCCCSASTVMWHARLAKTSDHAGIVGKAVAPIPVLTGCALEKSRKVDDAVPSDHNVRALGRWLTDELSTLCFAAFVLGSVSTHPPLTFPLGFSPSSYSVLVY